MPDETDAHDDPATDDLVGNLATFDPLAEATARRLKRVARRVHRVRSRRPHELVDLAADQGVPMRRLRLLGDAWAEGGSSGIEAIGPAMEAPPAQTAHAAVVLESWRARHHPEVCLRWDVWRNRVTVWWLVPDPEQQRIDRRPLLQLRLTSGGRWHLFHRAALGEWWPVVIRGPRAAQTVDDCLAAVERDAGNRFWRDAEDPTATLQDPLGRHDG